MHASAGGIRSIKYMANHGMDNGILGMTICDDTFLICLTMLAYFRNVIIVMSRIKVQTSSKPAQRSACSVGWWLMAGAGLF
jgi:hypothetical protein